ncbi:hypothetical protein [Halomicrobium salinisoli]|uniref:hypothetical protein n=1 Tax=Halomicrobium salinisoli TaxID=2878391 RepID=UPI001CF08729|nr:hypothetical protein [Halomicrobium salinisoli]
MRTGLRYGLLAVGLLAVGALGVLVGVGPGSDGPALREAPAPPAEANESAALRYAEGLERTRLHNRIVNATAPDRVETGCENYSVAATPSGRYVFVRCSAMAYEDGSVAGTEPLPSSALYRITDEGYTRAEARGRSAPEVQPDAPEPPAFHGRSVSVYSFGERERALTVAITAVNSSGDASREYAASVEPNGGVALSSVVTTPATYRVEVRTDGRSATGAWTVTDESERLFVVADSDGLWIAPVREQ